MNSAWRAAGFSVGFAASDRGLVGARVSQPGVDKRRPGPRSPGLPVPRRCQGPRLDERGVRDSGDRDRRRTAGIGRCHPPRRLCRIRSRTPGVLFGTRRRQWALLQCRPRAHCNHRERGVSQVASIFGGISSLAATSYVNALFDFVADDRRAADAPLTDVPRRYAGLSAAERVRTDRCHFADRVLPTGTGGVNGSRRGPAPAEAQAPQEPPEAQARWRSPCSSVAMVGWQ